jgi:D-threo-aldose 1-dehydrogenase
LPATTEPTSTTATTGRAAPSHHAPPGPLGFGGAPLGNLFEAVPDRVARGAVDAAWEAGVRYFDTAPLYGSGLSEHRIGAALRERDRDSFELSTKVGRLLRPDAAAPANDPYVDTLPFRVEHDYSYDGAMRSIEDSLQRLGTTRIDVAYIHDVGRDAHGDDWEAVFATAMGGAARALMQLRDEGVIRGWGLGVNVVDACERALAESDPDVFLLAGRYTLLEQSPARTFFPAVAERGAHVVVGGPYNSGLLAGGSTYDYAEAPRELVERRDRIAAICGRHGVDPRAAALQFCAAHPVVAAVIPGAQTPDRVRENGALMTAPIPAALWGELRSAGLLLAEAVTPA